MNILLIFLGKFITKFSRSLNLGHGSTWPGHIALNSNKNFIKDILKNSKIKIILIAGTNGKTTTSKLLQSILEEDQKKVILNESGANLLNGIASALILNTNIFGKIKKDFAIFETDENTLPQVLKELTPDVLVLLNLFRDQLDRYGEVNTIASKWKLAIDKLPKKTTLILNANDPTIVYLGKEKKTLYFGLNEKSNLTHAQDWADSVFCPRCNSKLEFEKIYFSHIGIWQCQGCGLKTPDIDLKETYSPLLGTYNKLNTLAAVLAAKTLGVNLALINKALKNFNPAFGRQEEVKIDGKKIKIYLSKNPTGFNESLRTVSSGKSILLVLNDRIPDGTDVSWIWDVDFENSIKNFNSIVVSGDRTYDLALRLRYASSKKIEVEKDLQKAIKKALKNTSEKQTLYILPTYSAMLETRKILTGKKIL
ncbi:MAG TPA: Mur ligase family protein [Patescibacteria group bacterium]|nr:Mur ligase family protein [Patescibacteria group bacterium]